MIRVCHLFDDSTGWEQRVGVGQLLDRLPADRFRQMLAGMDGRAGAVLAPLGRRVEWVLQRSMLAPLAALGLGRYLKQRHTDLVHAWGISAAARARSAGRLPLIVTCFDPEFARRDVNALRVVAARPEPFAVACASQRTRRRLVERGVPSKACVVLRPAVDFAAITAAQRGFLRQDIGVPTTDFMVILPEPVTRAGGHFEAAWTLLVAAACDPSLRLVLPAVPQRFGEGERIRRLASSALDSGTVVCPAICPRFEQLVIVADALLIMPKGDTSVTSVAWAMAAGTVVIGCAGYSLAELIAHKHNGLLFKRGREARNIIQVGSLLSDRRGFAACAEVARGQAYEVFGLKRFADQHIQLYDNLLSGRPPAEGIVDSAAAA